MSQPLVLQMESAIPVGGGFSTIFVSEDKARVIKVFKPVVFATDYPNSEDNRRISSAICGAECEAYEIAMRDPELQKHVPTYHGRREITQIVDATGHDYSHRYYLNLAYEVERIAGKDRKLNMLPTTAGSALAPLIAKFHGAGVHYLEDASCFGWDSPEAIKLIDFATWNPHEVLADELAFNGRLSDGNRAKWP